VTVYDITITRYGQAAHHNIGIIVSLSDKCAVKGGRNGGGYVLI
jgi:hypothetical protein